MKRLAGYIREYPKCGDLKTQRETVEGWYWRHGKHEWAWHGLFREKRKGHKNLPHPTHITSRPRLGKLMDQFGKGDMILVPWWGVLCHDIDDAMEGIPMILGLGIRILCVADGLELNLDHVRFMRILCRDWSFEERKKPVLPGEKRKGDRPWIKIDEVRFMQFCYLQQVVHFKSRNEIAKLAMKSGWRRHPRLGTEVKECNVKMAIEKYRDILLGIQMGRAMPSWIKTARGKGYFNETLKDVVELRAAEFQRFTESLHK